MVVEDHDLIREALAATLRAEPDIELVACCPDGQTAIDNLDQAKPDVVVTDLSLPPARRRRSHRPPAPASCRRAGRGLHLRATRTPRRGGPGCRRLRHSQQERRPQRAHRRRMRSSR
jgi:DNA-binding NarL/FixJ family response regulator